MGCVIGKCAADTKRKKNLDEINSGFSDAINQVFRIDPAPSQLPPPPPSTMTDQLRKIRANKGKFDDEVSTKYDFKNLIGQGTSSRVWMAENRRTKQPYAVKVVKGRRDQFDAEIVVMSRLRHANVVQLVEVFRTVDNTYMVMELATGGDLFDRIESQGPFNERDAVRVLRMVVEGVRYLHASGVTHRDLKLDNILFYHPGQNSKILIADFALACRPERPTKGSGLMNTVCGTPEYMAPEVFARQSYTCSVDMWAVGVITYTVLSATFPFDDESNSRLCRLIVSGHYSYQGAVWNNVNECAKDFIDHLLRLDPASRMTAASALKHSWMRGSNINVHGKDGADLQRAISSSSSSSSSRSTHSGSLGSSRRRRKHVRQHELELLQKDPEWNRLREQILVSVAPKSFES